MQDRGAIEFLGTGTDRVLATLIAPQINNGTAADEAAMTHADVSYGPPGGNVAPFVQITSPAAGASIPLAATTITAAASDSDGIVALAEFYANGAFIADDTTSPYGVSWTPAATGSYRLTAIAMDDRGAITMSDTVRVTATSMPAPTPAPSGGGRGGGGAPSLWFVAALSLLGAARFARSGAAASEARDL